MINSLYKDSHITQPFGIRYFEKRSQNDVQNKRQNKTVNNSNITTSFSKPAEVHFCGLAGARLANTNSFKTLMENVNKFFSKKPKMKEIKEILADSVLVLEGKTKEIKGKTEEIISKRISKAQSFLEKNKNNMEDVIKEAKDFVKKDVDEDIAEEIKVGRPVTSGDKVKMEEKGLTGAFQEATEGFPALAKGDKSFYASNKLKKLLSIANDHKSVFGALFALVLTCSLRPGAILVLPSSKKNADDNKYAAAHSIASGIIGAIISIAVLLPLSKGMEKIAKEPSKYIKDAESTLRKDKKIMETAKTFVSMLSDSVTSIPKGIITIALIPIVLKNIFDMEKKKPKTEDKNRLYLSDNPAAINQNKPENTQRVASKSVKGGIS